MPGWNQVERCMPASAFTNLEAVAERTVDGADQGVPTVLVRRAHAADVSCEMPLGNEIGQRRLIQRRRKEIESVARIDKPGQERRGTTRYPSLSAGNRTLLNVPM